MGDELLDWADRYIEMGLSVIALSGKSPNGAIHKRWSAQSAFRKGYAGLKDKHAAFTHPDTTGIGILTGPVYYVVDIDGEEGAYSWREIMGGLSIPDRWVARTGRGLHLWFATPEPWPTAKLGEKLDFKGIGGYVAAPPSLHPNGNRYEWLLEPSFDEPPWNLPDEVEAILKAIRFAKTRRSDDRVVRKRAREAMTAEGVIQNVQNFEGILDTMKNAGPGERNNVLNWAAYTMIGDGADDADLQALAQAALAVGLPEFEVVRTINSAQAALNE